jgi:hypothetical protein
MKTRIERLIEMTGNDPRWTAEFNAMQYAADKHAYQVVLMGKWGFEPVIGASDLNEATHTAQEAAKRYDAHEWEIWNSDGLRISSCYCKPPSRGC